MYLRPGCSMEHWSIYPTYLEWYKAMAHAGFLFVLFIFTNMHSENLSGVRPNDMFEASLKGNFF